MASYKSAWVAKFQDAIESKTYEALLVAPPHDDDPTWPSRKALIKVEAAIDVLCAYPGSRIGARLLELAFQMADEVLAPGYLEGDSPDVQLQRGDATLASTYAGVLLGRDLDMSALRSASGNFAVHADSVPLRNETLRAYKEDYRLTAARLALIAGDRAGAASILGAGGFVVAAEEARILGRMATLEGATYRSSPSSAQHGLKEDLEAFFDKVRDPDGENFECRMTPAFHLTRFETGAIRRRYLASLDTPADWLAVIEDISA